MEQIPDNYLDGVLIDPPYGEAMGYEGDDTLSTAEELLGSFLKKVEPKAKRNAHIAIFWTFRNLDVCIDTLRNSGFMYRRTLSMYIPKGNARPYLGWLPRTQAIVIGQKYLPKTPSEFHTEMAEYLAAAVERSGLSRNQIAKRLGCDSRLVMKWTRVGDPAWCLPTPRFYKPLKEILKLDDTFDILLTREPSSCHGVKGDFEYKHDTYIVDDKNEKMLHPSQKPLAVVEHLVTCLAPRGGIILDGFSGSGTTAVACQRTGRNFIAFEANSDYCEIARTRLSHLQT
jgi:DNA modification methylase